MVTTGSLIEQKHYIYAGSEMVALYTKRSTGANDTRYFHTDHLGSVNVITDESGNVVERDSFDAWGKRRFPNGADDPNNTITSLNPRGFTFQEHLDNVALVHMNGRVYDPLLGRFTSADPFVQFPDSTQGFNRYAYTGNNPLSYTDPSGYDYDYVGGAPYPGGDGYPPGQDFIYQPTPTPGADYPDPGAGAFPPSLGVYFPGKGAPGHGSVIGGNLKTAIPGNLYGWTGSMDLSQFGPVSNNMAAASSSLWAMSGSSFSNAAHFGLGLLSLPPVVGSFFSGLDAAYYAIQGDYKGASLAFFGAIPFVGAFAHITEVGRGVSEAINVSSEAVNAVNNGLRTSATVSAERAQAFLMENGMPADRAKSFIDSFEGPITARLVRPGEEFYRYTDIPNTTGSFLTKTQFANPAATVDGLYLGPYGNTASLMQSVTSSGRSIVLEGGIANGGNGITQSLIVNRNAFQFNAGVPY